MTKIKNNQVEKEHIKHFTAFFGYNISYCQVNNRICNKSKPVNNRHSLMDRFGLRLKNISVVRKQWKVARALLQHFSREETLYRGQTMIPDVKMPTISFTCVAVGHLADRWHHHYRP